MSSQHSALESALATLEREDPSLRVKFIEETDGIEISGLGELHIDIIKKRLLKDFKLDAHFGPLQVAYLEAVTKPARRLASDMVTVSGQNFSVAYDIEIRPSNIKIDHPKVDVITSTKDSQIEFIKHSEMKALELGLESACRSGGPCLRSPIEPSFDCRLYGFAITPGTSMAIISATFSKAVRALFQDAAPVILEPFMSIEVSLVYFLLLMTMLLYCSHRFM